MNRCGLLFVLASAMLAHASNDATAVEGFVRTDTAAIVVGANVGIDSLTRGFHQQTKTDISGFYKFDNLFPGDYSIWAEIKGFGCIIYPHVAVFAGQRVHQDFNFVRAQRYPGDSCDSLAQHKRK